MTLKLRLLSDVHNEFSQLNLTVMDDEHEQILILAGDIGLADKPQTFVPFLEEMCSRFQDVIYVTGNHEAYHTSIDRVNDKILSSIRLVNDAPNLHLLENQSVTIDDVTIIGATLWSSFNNGDPIAMWDAERGMNDYRVIRTGPKGNEYQRKFKPNDALSKFVQSKDYIFKTIKEEKEKGQKVVVVTHMGPSFQSVHEMYRTGHYANLNGAYVSNLEYDIVDAQPSLWIHGHVHNSFDYMIDQTRVVTNPRGYAGHGTSGGENLDFNPTFVIEV